MKITMEIDCTPVEARQFFGFPDFQPLQSAVLGELEKNIMQEAQRLSPEAVMKLWFTTGPEWFRGMLDAMQKAAQAK